MADAFAPDASESREDVFEGEAAPENEATIVAELRERLDRHTLARALGVKPAELEMIAAGYPAKPQTVERLHLLHQVASRTEDLKDPGALLAALDFGSESGRSLSFALVPCLKTYLIAFVIIDALVFAGFVLALFLLQ
jgi:hypothetical protein